METTEDSQPKKNMRVGLIIFGSLSIILGALFFLLIPLMLVSTVIPVKGQPTLTLSMLMPACVMYLVMGVIDIVLGVGSVQCKRWARSLLLLWSIFWIFSGSCGLIGFALTSGQMESAMATQNPQMPATIAAGVKTATLFFMAIFYIALPASYIFFYSLRDTRLTCEDRNPLPAWTDACPTVVLGLVLMSGMWALCIPLMPFFTPVFPFFGHYLEGASAFCPLLVFCAGFGWAAWGMYHQKINAWWTSFVLMLVLSASYIVTFNHGGLMEMYHHMQLPEQTMKLLESSPVLKSSWIGWAGLLFVVPYVGVMLYARKYFVRSTAITEPS